MVEILRLLQYTDTTEEVVKKIMEIISNIHQQPRMQEHMVKMIIEVQYTPIKAAIMNSTHHPPEQQATKLRGDNLCPPRVLSHLFNALTSFCVLDVLMLHCALSDLLENVILHCNTWGKATFINNDFKESYSGKAPNAQSKGYLRVCTNKTNQCDQFTL